MTVTSGAGATTGALPLASFKLQLESGRVRVVPSRGTDGAPFTGPGVDLVGDDAAAAFAAARALGDWLRAREPGITMRSISMDLQAGRVLVTYHPSGERPANARPHVLRLVPPLSWELVAAAAPVVAVLGPLAAARLAARALSP